MTSELDIDTDTSRFSFQTDTVGSGGFAKVFKGRDNTLERDIAVKVLNQITTSFGESDQERFRREARILAALSHPNIPAIYDVDFSQGHFLIIFQFIQGTTLADLLAAEDRSDIGSVRSWFRQLASAVQHAHALGIVHRDIKPDNIIITSDRETAYLVDFGIALSKSDAEKLTMSGYVVGTQGYMSPEQQAGEDVDYKTDLYSMAVTMYEALAGKALPRGQYQALSLMDETIPPEIDDLVQDCIKPKERRLETAAAFGTRLARALHPHKPLSEVLASGKLHEIALALEPITPQEFAELPEGQKSLVLIKMTDIVESDDPHLQYPSGRFLDLMVTRGLMLSADEYRQIVEPAVEWGFERQSGVYVGNPKVRQSLVVAASQAGSEAHAVLSEVVEKCLAKKELEVAEDWLLNSARESLQTLLANPACGTAAPSLAKLLREVNDVQRTHRRADDSGDG